MPRARPTGWVNICSAIVYAAAMQYRGPRMGWATLARADALLLHYDRYKDQP